MSWATACLVGHGVMLMTFCAAILPWLSYGDKDHVILLFLDKNVSQLEAFLLHLTMMHRALGCILPHLLLQIPPPLLKHCSLIPPGHLKKSDLRPVGH